MSPAIFVQVQDDEPWTAEQFEDLRDTIAEAVDDELQVVVMDDTVHIMSKGELETYVNDLVDALEG